MQAALNVARKAEIRVNKLHAAYEAAQEQWAQFDRLTKENYQREHRRFQKDLERIEKEALDAEAQQQRSREAVLKIANGQAPEPVQPGPTGADANVTALFEAWVAEDNKDLDGVYHRAPQAQPPSTPLDGCTGAPMTPTMTGRPSLVRATEDPYLGATGALPGSPTPGNLATGGPLTGAPPGLSPGHGQIPKHPGQRDKCVLRAPTADAQPRPGIKEATKARAALNTGHVPLEVKLQERRDLMRNALRPFGLAPKEPAPSAPGDDLSTTMARPGFHDSRRRRSGTLPTPARCR